VERLHCDIIALQEVWQPTDGSIHLRNFSQPILKIRSQKAGGGVALIPHKKVKSLHLKEFDVDGLEAVWAEVMIRHVRTVIGSVYVPPGDISALDLLDNIIGHILSQHSQVVICMDANSRNILWDDSCIGLSPSQRSVQMGVKLENIVNKYDLHIHNNGTATYRSGDITTAPDVTLSTGLTKYGNINWSTVDYDFRSPHDGIVLEIGTRVDSFRKELINWKCFDSY